MVPVTNVQSFNHLLLRVFIIQREPGKDTNYFYEKSMAKPMGKKVDIEKIADQYLSRFKGQPDAMRLLMNMLADNLTDIDQLKNQIIKHEFSLSIAQPRADKSSIIQQLAETYGVTKSRIQEIVKEV